MYSRIPIKCRTCSHKIVKFRFEWFATVVRGFRGAALVGDGGRIIGRLSKRNIITLLQPPWGLLGLVGMVFHHAEFDFDTSR